MSAPAGSGASSLVVENAYQWVGAAGAGGLVVYVDGNRAGVATLGGQLRLRVDPGEHRLRVRLWWYFSPVVELTVEAGQTRRFSADIPRQRMVLARMVRAFVDPLHSLSLTEVVS